MTLDEAIPTSAPQPAELQALWARATEANTRTYRICGRILQLRCNDASYTGRFAQVFRHLSCCSAAPGDPISEITFLTQEAGPGGFPALVDLANEQIHVFKRMAIAPSQLFFCLAFIERRMFPLPDHLILHGAALEYRGAVTALVGRTFSGKSTLGLRLALEPNVAFLSDEFCPIRLADGVVEPFPRGLQLRPRAYALLAEKGLTSPEAARETGGDYEVDPGDIRGLCLGRGGPIRNIVLLGGEEIGPMNKRERLLDLEFLSPSVLADLRAIPGVRAVHALDGAIGSGKAVRLEVQDGWNVTQEVIRLCREKHGMEQFGFLPAGARRPDFTHPPSLVAVPTMRGVLETLRHLANLKTLEDRLGPGYPKVLDCMAAHLGNVRFFSVRPGPLEESCALIRQFVLDGE